MAARLKSLYQKLGLIEKIFLVLFVLAWVLGYAVPASGFRLLITFAVWITGLIVAIRLANTGIKKAIWRLRNRLIVAYAFIAMVPIALILALVAVSTYGLTGQIALYLVNSELDRRTSILRGAANAITHMPPAKRQEMIEHTDDFTRRLFPTAELLVRDGTEYRYPADAKLTIPPADWKDKDVSGIIVKDGKLYSWALANARGTTVEIMAPLHQDFLSELVPNLGDLDFRVLSAAAGPLVNGLSRADAAYVPHTPPKNNLLDVQVTGAAPVSIMFWDAPNVKDNKGLLLVHTRMSAVLGTVFGSNISLGDLRYGQVIWILFLVTVTLFLIVELVSLVIGVSISRTITSAVHELYTGTRRVKEGDFSHRIPVRGNDQLAEWAHPLIP